MVFRRNDPEVFRRVDSILQHFRRELPEIGQSRGLLRIRNIRTLPGKYECGG